MGIRDSLLDEMLPEFSESMSILPGRNDKWGIGKGKGNGSRIGKSLSKISTHFLRAGMCERGKVARKMYF